MSKTIKQSLMTEYRERVSADGGQIPAEAMLLSLRGLKAVDTTRARARLRQKKVRVTVIRNSLAKKAFEGSPLAQFNDLLTGANALAYGGSVVEIAREVVELAKTMPAIELKGAILDGTLYSGKAGVEELSKYPTRGEAIAQVVTLVISPGRTLVGQVLGPGRTVAGLVKAIEGRLEKGESIAKKAG